MSDDNHSSIEAGELIQIWTKLLKDIWIGEETKIIKHELCQSVLNEIFDECEDPMETALLLHKSCPDYGAQKTSSLADSSFAVGTSKHTIHLELITNIFQLKSDDMADHILQAVKNMIANTNYRDAISCATLFGLQSYFTLVELVIPCMLQDRFIAVDAFIKNERKMQEELTRYFDNLIGLDKRTIDYRYEDFRKRKIMTIPASKLQKKAIEKLVTKLLTTYNLPSQEVAPNLSRFRREGALRHTAFMYFVEHGITEEGYFDYVAQALQSDLDLQKYFINYLCSNGWISDAIRWVVFCNVKDCAPRCLQPYLCNSKILEVQADLARITSKRASITNVELFPGHPIKMIATAEDLERLYPVIEEADLIGIDTEWKPLFMCTSERVALFQVCVQHCSYLVDVVTLENVLTEEQWTRFFKALFSDSTAIKLASPPPPPNETENLSDTLSSDETMRFRLTDLCQKVLGQALDKREQIGNWAMRPLRREQMKYAAMDGYCLLNLYDKLKIKAERREETQKKGAKFDDREFEQMIERINSGPNNSEMKKKPKDLKVIVDSMMLGLGKHLRRCGIDTILAETRSYLIECAERDPNRYIITCGKAIDELRRHRSLRKTQRILSVPTAQNMNIIQQIEFVLRQLNMHLSKDDIFSLTENTFKNPNFNSSAFSEVSWSYTTFQIMFEEMGSLCSLNLIQKCNSNSFVIAPSPVLEAMYQANTVASDPFNEEVDAELYSGYGCHLEISENNHSWIVAHCHNGILEIENCLVAALGCDMPAKVKIEKVFYICGICGTVYWDGCHITNYNAFVEPLFADEK
ncbi:hypothetical protein DINM_005424 [Dirofilaria immitis]|nr:hypothetical protein [Dirofilaria immitis]